MSCTADKLVAACCSLLVAGPALAQGDAREWLDRMEDAVEYLNYSGVFIHIHDQRAETMKVVHRFDGEKITERYYALNGPRREIIRENDTVKCILPDKQSVLVERLAGQTALQARLPAYTTQLEDAYQFKLQRRTGSVAGRTTRIIQIRPRDRYRYGYRLWLDEETAMLLKSQLLSDDDEIIEQLMFASINIQQSIPDSELEPVTDHEGYTWYRQEATTRAREKDNTAPLWRAARLPNGFVLTESRTRMMAGSDEPVEHLVYSDGLATVSVFVELPAKKVDSIGGLSRLGAANAFETSVDAHLITAVGEVPAPTVELIAKSVQPTTVGAMR